MTTRPHYWPIWWKGLTMAACVGAAEGIIWLAGLPDWTRFVAVFVAYVGGSWAYDSLEYRHRPGKPAERTG